MSLPFFESRNGSSSEGGDYLVHVDKYDAAFGFLALAMLGVARYLGVDSGFEQLASAGVGLFWGLSLRGQRA